MDFHPFFDMRMGCRQRLLLPVPFFLGAMFAALLWFTSPIVFGTIEPWDGSLPRYFAAIAAVGFVSALPAPRVHWTAAVGVACGQSVAVYFVNGNGFGMFGILVPAFCILFSIPALLGSFAARQLAGRRQC
jgi:hypothetical protein